MPILFCYVKHRITFNFSIPAEYDDTGCLYALRRRMI